VVVEFPPARFRCLWPCEVVVDHYLSFSEHTVGHDKGEEFVGAAEGKHVLNFTKGQNVVGEDLGWNIRDYSPPCSRHHVTAGSVS